jgi:hypothetical protein
MQMSFGMRATIGWPLVDRHHIRHRQTENAIVRSSYPLHSAAQAHTTHHRELGQSSHMSQRYHVDLVRPSRIGWNIGGDAVVNEKQSLVDPSLVGCQGAVEASPLAPKMSSGSPQLSSNDRRDEWITVDLAVGVVKRDANSLPPVLKNEDISDSRYGPKLMVAIRPGIDDPPECIAG